MMFLRIAHRLAFVTIVLGAGALMYVATSGGGVELASRAESLASYVIGPAALVSLATGSFLASEASFRFPGVGRHIAAAMVVAVAALGGPPLALSHGAANPDALSTALMISSGATLLLALLAMALARLGRRGGETG